MSCEDQDKLFSVVVGVGSAGIRAMEDMIAAKVEYVRFVAVDTNSAKSFTTLTEVHPSRSSTGHIEVTDQESTYIKKATIIEIESELKDAVVVFIVAEMGDTTVSDTVRAIANITKDIGIYITVGILTLPISLDCTYLHESAENDIRSICSYFDSLVVIPNYLAVNFDFSSMGTLKVIKVPTEVVRGITDLLGSINLTGLDFADVKAVLPSECPVTFGVGMASGNDRGLEAAMKALHPLSCGCVDIYRASGALVSITGSSNLSMEDYNDVNRFIHGEIHKNARIKIGVARDDSMGDAVKVAVYLSNITK